VSYIISKDSFRTWCCP